MTIMRDNYLSLVKKWYVLRLDEQYKLVLLPSSQQDCLDYQKDVVIPTFTTSGVDCNGNFNNNNDNTRFYYIKDSDDSEESDEFEGDDDDDEDCDDVEEEYDDNTDDDDDDDGDEEQELKKDEQEKKTQVQRTSNTEYKDDNGKVNFTNSPRPMIESWADEEWSDLAADDLGIPEWARTFGINFNNIADYDRAPESFLINRPDEDSVINLISIPESGVVYNDNIDELSKSVLNKTNDHKLNQPSQYPPRALTTMADCVFESLINRPDEDSVIDSVPESGVVYNVDELSTANITLVDIAEYFAQHGLLNVSTTNTNNAAMETYESIDTDWQHTTNELNGTIGYFKPPTYLPAANVSVNVPDSSYTLINANEQYNEHVIPNQVTEILSGIMEYEPPSDLATFPMVYNDIHNDSYIRSKNDAAQLCMKVYDRSIEPSREEPWTVARGVLPDLETIPIFDDEEIGCNKDLVDASTLSLSNNVSDQMEDNITISDVKQWLATMLNQQQIAIAADHTYSTASINMDDTAKDDDIGYQSPITNSNKDNDIHVCYETEQSSITDSNKVNNMRFEAEQSPITNFNKVNVMCYEAEESHITNSNKVNNMCNEAEQSHVTNSNKDYDMRYKAEASQVINYNTCRPNANNYYEDISSDEDSYIEAPVAVTSSSTHPIFPQYGQGDYYKSNEENVYPNLWTLCSKNRNLFNWAEEALYHTRPSVIKELKPTGLDPNFPIHIDNKTLKRNLKMNDSEERSTKNMTQCSRNRNLFNWAEEALYHTRPSVIKELKRTGLDPNVPIHFDNGTLKRNLEMDDLEERPTKRMRFRCDQQHSTKDRNVFNWAQETFGQASYCVPSHAMTIPSLEDVNKQDRKRKLETDQSTDLNDLTDKRRRLTSNVIPSESSNRKSIFAWAVGEMLY